MKKKIKSVLFWAGIPLLSTCLVMGFRYAEVHWLEYLPILECPRVLDLGEWNTREVAFGRFRIKNCGKKPLIAKGFSTSCSCARVGREIDGRFSSVQTIDLPPAEEVELAVRFSIGAQPGESQSVEVFFQTNDPVRPVWYIDVIVPRVGGGYFAQPSAAVFGSLLVGEKTRRTIDLFNNRVEGRQVESVRSTHPDRFDVKLVPLSAEDKQRVHRTAGKLFARIEVIPRSENSGPLSGEITVSLVKESHRTPPIAVVGEVVRSVVCRPTMLVLPRRMRDQLARSGDVLIFHRREKPIEVVLDPLPPEITVKVQAVSGRPDQRLLHIEWNSAANPKKRSTTETRFHFCVHADGEEMTLEVPVFFTENRS